MILTRLLLKKVALGHRRTCLCHYSKMIFLQNCSLHARENLSSEPDFRWLFWQSSTWKLVKLSGTRWTWIFSKSNTIANRTKKPIHSGSKSSKMSHLNFHEKMVKIKFENSTIFKSITKVAHFNEMRLFWLIFIHCDGVLLEEENAIENYSRRSWRQQHMVQWQLATSSVQ